MFEQRLMNFFDFLFDLRLFLSDFHQLEGRLHFFVEDRELLKFVFVLVKNFIIEFFEGVTSNDIETYKKQVLKIRNIPVTWRLRPSNKLKRVISLHKIKIGNGEVPVVEVIMNEKLVNLQRPEHVQQDVIMRDSFAFLG